MKKAFLLFAVILIGSMAAFAQTVSNTIQVTGKSEISIIPDEAIVMVNIQKKSLKASDASAMLNKKIKEVENLVKKSDIKDYKITTENYRVNINRIYRDGSAKDSGYIASQTVKIKLENPKNDIVKLVENLNNIEEIMYDVSFSISDEMTKTYEKELLKSALLDAKEKALQISETMELGELKVHNINYSSSQSNYPRPVQMEYMRAQKNMSDGASPTFTPEEQKLSDEVHVTFKFVD
ncbi:SIMPL domain-containing protein [Echinicola sp. 20G]|uniref:SIMPL domain-containing protein n=1 Tax=Echinicola sp. 20G TaxID=2781961 RepID=UPI001910948A|nr:SIMPL domain-containing protein [Echinicola sp. 20G]